MELYESLFIIRPSVSDEETNTLIDKMKAVAVKTGAQFIKAENWGKKKLAYELRHERKGTYAYFYFRAPNTTVGELERAYRLEDNILKFLTVHLEKELVPPRLLANTPAKANLVLAQPLTIPAGQPLPMPYSVVLTQVPLDTPLPGGVVPGDQRTDGSGQFGVTVQKDWVVPAGMSANDNTTIPLTNYTAGQTIPAGSNISGFGGAFPVGYVVPSGTFSNSIRTPAFTYTTPAGSVQSTATTYAAGAVIPAGTTLNVTVAVQQPTVLSPRFFASGFANYDINGGTGTLVTNGTAVAPTMPVYRFTASGYAARTGAGPAAALSLWQPPLFTENPLNATLTQRAGASVTLHSLIKGGLEHGGGPIVIGDGASITVDPGQSIKLDAYNRITMDGRLTAHGGSITLINESDNSLGASRNFDAYGQGRLPCRCGSAQMPRSTCRARLTRPLTPRDGRMAPSPMAAAST